MCVGPLAVVCVWIAEASFGELVAAAAGATIATVATQQLLSGSSSASLPSFGADATFVLKGGETDATRLGREAHRDKDYGEGFIKEFTLPSGKRCDAYNPETCEVKELKPNNKRAKRRGAKQVEEYVKELEEATGKKHTGTVETYDP